MLNQQPTPLISKARFMTDNNQTSAQMFESLAILHLSQGATGERPKAALRAELHAIGRMTEPEFAAYLDFAEVQRIQIRTLQILAAASANFTSERRLLIQQQLMEEKHAAERAVAQLSRVVGKLTQHGLETVVIKTLDHWPDIGSDLDLFVAGNPREMLRVMTDFVGARILPQSWGDKLACKWNFELPDFPQPIEIHVNRLGQTGEQFALPVQVVKRSREKTVGGLSFRVPAPEERIAIATLQRMYRHFYIRLTDIVNIGKSVRASEINFLELRQTAETGALWPGVATLLRIVSDYNARYSVGALDLPPQVTAGACFGKEATYFANRFLRVPMLPQAARLYLRQWMTTGAERKYTALSRLTLLPILAAVAFMNLRLTGSDKGIW